MTQQLEKRVSLACSRFSRKNLIVSASRLVIRGVTPKTLRRTLRRLSADGVLLRAGPDRYVLNDPSSQVLEDSKPTTVFPWWGSKKKALGLLVAILRREVTNGNASSIVSPFVGTGVVEGSLKNQGITVHSFDKDPNIVNIHKVLGSPSKRKLLCSHFRNETSTLRRSSTAERKRRFKRVLRDSTLTSNQSSGVPLHAARWLLGMKCAFHGMLRRTSSLVEGRLDSLRVDSICEAIFTHRGVGPGCRKASVLDVIKNTPKQRKTLFFLDPPYLVEEDQKQYSAGDFTLKEHEALAHALRGRWFVLCHREDERIKNLYPQCEIVRLPPIMQINAVGKRREEMVIIGRASDA